MEQAMIGTQEPGVPEMIGKAGTDVEINGLYQQAQMICVFTLALPTIYRNFWLLCMPLTFWR